MMDDRRFAELTSRFPDRAILVVGDLMLDEWIWGKVSRVSPEAPVPVVAVDKRTYTPGGASNVAANLRSLGAKTHVAGLVGSDDPGKILKRELAKRGADVRGIFSMKGSPTTLKTRIIAHSQQVVRADVEAVEKPDGSFTRQMLDFLVPLIEKVDAVLFSDYNKGALTQGVVSKIIEKAAAKGKVVVAGAKPANLALFSGASLMIMNQHEAEIAIRSDLSPPAEFKKAGFKLLQHLHLGGVLITQGEHGMTLFEKNGNASSIPAQATQVYDVSGAGDTVAAVAALALASGANLREAAHLANRAAGVVVKKVGTATVSVSELEAQR